MGLREVNAPQLWTLEKSTIANVSVGESLQFQTSCPKLPPQSNTLKDTQKTANACTPAVWKLLKSLVSRNLVFSASGVADQGNPTDAEQDERGD